MEKEVLQRIESLANEHGESHWLVDRRIAALNEIEDGLPEGFEFKTLDFKRSNKEIMPLTDTSNIDLIQLGQRLIKNNLSEDLEDQGVILTDIFTALREHPRLIQRYFMDKIINVSESDLTRYHLAMINSGIFLYIPKDVKIDQTINIRIFQDSTVNNAMISHILIVAEENSSVNFKQISETLGNKKNIVQPFVEILTRANSQVNYQAVDQFSKDSRVYFDCRGYLNRDSKIDWNFKIKNKGETTGQIANILFGSNATARVKLDSENKNNKINLSVKKHGKNVNYEETIV